MMAKRAVHGLLTLVGLLAFSLSVLAAESAEKCALCGMNLAGNENTAYEITFNDGKVVTYCCPHCGLWEHASQKANVKSARARDFINGEWADPAKMYFVVGGSAVPACAPSWIAFSKKEEARKFTKGFGGKVRSFEEALKERVKSPKGMSMGMEMSK